MTNSKNVISLMRTAVETQRFINRVVQTDHIKSLVQFKKIISYHTTDHSISSNRCSHARISVRSDAAICDRKVQYNCVITCCVMITHRSWISVNCFNGS
jgi:hypothetical protein